MTTSGNGVNLDSGCSIPPSIILDTDDSSSYTITASDRDGCSSAVTFNPTDSDQQYGTAATLPGTCGLDTSTPVDFVPIMFWFFHTANNGTGQARAIICRPTLELRNIEAEVYLVNNSVIDVQLGTNFTKPNNITGSPLNGRPYNGYVAFEPDTVERLIALCIRVIFTQTNMNDFVKARAVAIGSQIPGAIFRYASQNPALLQQFFDSSVEFLPLTERIYVCTIWLNIVCFVALVLMAISDATSRCQRLISLLHLAL